MYPFESRGPSKISPEEVKRMLDTGAHFYLIDVRNPDEYARGHVRGSLLVPLDTLRASFARTGARKDNLIVVYCQSGVRAAKAVSILESMGYTNVKSMGGIQNWPYALQTGR